MKAKRLISASSSRFAAQLFNIITVGVMMISLTTLLLGKLLVSHKVGFLPLVLSMPPVMIWLAASMFVYAAIAHHPNETVRHYNKWAGYRYYGIVGFLTIFANDIAHLPTGWTGVWVLMGVALIPWSLYDLWRAGKEDWQDLVVEDVHKVGVHI